MCVMRCAGRARDAGERAELVDHHRGELGGLDLHDAPTEALAVGKADMGADIDAARQRQPDRAHP